MTADDRIEVAEQLAMLAVTTIATGSVPESVDADDASQFTRAEFGWANATYADLVFRTASTFRPVVPERSAPFFGSAGTPIPALVTGLAALENDAAIVSAMTRMFPTKPLLER
jgi:hypothetical protein